MTDLPVEPSRRVLAVLAAVVVVLVVAAAFAVIEIRHASHGNSLSSERTEVTTLAGQYAVDFTSIDYRTMAAESKSETKNATAAFAKVYAATVQAFTTFYTKGQIVETTSVERSALASLTATSAVALVALKGVTTTANNKAGTQQLLRMRVTLTKVDGHWLTSNLTPL
jgi:Mce-associated membrane protein